jgi:hypothetical protein
MKLFLRIYAHCSSDDQAAAINNRLISRLHTHGPVQSARPYPYWKIPAYYGFEFDLEGNTLEDYEAIVAMAHDGWEHRRTEHDRTSVWNHSADSTFLVPEAAWAEIQLLAEAPGPDAPQGVVAKGSNVS